MGYMYDFEEKLAPFMAGIPDGKRKEVVRIVKETAIESFRSGMTVGRLVREARRAVEDQDASAKTLE
jgi:hypothetical protein